MKRDYKMNETMRQETGLEQVMSSVDIEQKLGWKLEDKI